MNWFNEMLDAVRRIAKALDRIADTLDKLNMEPDFSAEDRIVTDTTTQVTEAENNIPK